LSIYVQSEVLDRHYLYHGLKFTISSMGGNVPVKHIALSSM
jgi:hypothetical protein